MTDLSPASPDGVATPGSRLSRKAFLGSAALLAGSGALLAACGGDDEPASTTGGTSTTDDAAATSAAALTLLNWHTATPDVGLGKGFTAIGRAYEAEVPDQTVRFQTKPFAAYVAAATTACRARKLASNVMTVPATNHGKIFPCFRHITDADAGPLLDELTGWDSSTVTPGESGTYAGYPAGGQGVLFYYNRALFERAGIDPEAEITVWDEFVNACERLKAAGIDPLGISGKDSFTPWWMWATFLVQQYPTQEDIDAFIKGEISFDTPGTVASLNAVKDTYDRGWWVTGFRDKTFAEVEADFIAGRVGIIPGIITDIVNWNVWDQRMGKDAYGVFTGPLIEGVKATEQVQTFDPALVSAVATDAENPAAADNFARYLVSKESAETLLRDAGMFPNRADVDVAAITRSPGAARIQEIVDANSVSGVTMWLNSTASGAAIPRVTSTCVDGDVQAFVSSIARLQEQGA